MSLCADSGMYRRGFRGLELCLHDAERHSANHRRNSARVYSRNSRRVYWQNYRKSLPLLNISAPRNGFFSLPKRSFQITLCLISCYWLGVCLVFIYDQVFVLFKNLLYSLGFHSYLFMTRYLLGVFFTRQNILIFYIDQVFMLIPKVFFTRSLTSL